MEGVVTTSLMNVAVEGVVGWGSGGSGYLTEGCGGGL